MRYFMNSNQQKNGDYEVHTEVCSYGKLVQSPLELGNFLSCGPAVQLANELYGSEAQRLQGRINGCFFCCNACHTG